LVIDGETYYSRAGGTATDVQTTSALNVDNSELHAILNLDIISAEDLKAGLYDYAAVSRFLVNYADLTMGRYQQQDGTLGQVTIDRQTFVAELRGRMQALQQTFGRTITPTCPYILGDADCTVDLGAGESPQTFTVSGQLDSVSSDGLTLFDSARTEPGPSGSIAISAITNANPAVVTLASAVTQSNGEAITLSGITTPPRLNGTWTIQNKGGSSFEINTDTTSDAAYTGSGMATPLGSESGFFDYGLITITGEVDSPTTSKNIGLSREVKSYVPGQWTLQEPFPYPLSGTEFYTMIAGCDKTFPTCRIKFDNVLNFGGFPFVPGQDSLMERGQAQ